MLKFFLNLNLRITSCRNVLFQDCEKIRFYKVENGTKKLSIKNCYFQEIVLHSDLSELLILGKSRFKNFDAEQLFNIQSLRRLQFDTNCRIEDDGMICYKILHSVSKRLGDKLQSHILYNRELEAYTKQKGFWTDDSLTVFFGRLINDNNRSTFRPILVLLIFNALMVFFINLQTCTHLSLGSFLLNTLNVWPLGVLASENSPHIAQTLDAIRKVGLSVIFYFIVNGALRFKYKF